MFFKPFIEEKIQINIRERATPDVEITQTTKEKGLYIFITVSSMIWY